MIRCVGEISLMMACDYRSAVFIILNEEKLKPTGNIVHHYSHQKAFFAIMPFLKPNQQIKSNAFFSNSTDSGVDNLSPANATMSDWGYFWHPKRHNMDCIHQFRISVIAWMRTAKNVKRNKLEKKYSLDLGYVLYIYIYIYIYSWIPTGNFMN